MKRFLPKFALIFALVNTIDTQEGVANVTLVDLITDLATHFSALSRSRSVRDVDTLKGIVRTLDHVPAVTGRRFGSSGGLGADRSSYDYALPSSYGSYGGASSYGGGGYGGGCCGGYGGYSSTNDLLPILALVALSLLLLYLITLATTTTAAGRRRRATDDNSLEEDEVMLDGSTWLSLIHEMWEQDGVVDDPSCAQHTLCRMNYLAMAAPGQAGWAVSLSSMPLSYLLHNRHNGGFSMYMDAALLGRAGANCTSLFSSCPRLH